MNLCKHMHFDGVMHTPCYECENEQLRSDNASLKAELAESKKIGELVDTCYTFINSPITIESCKWFNDAVEAMKGK